MVRERRLRQGSIPGTWWGDRPGGAQGSRCRADAYFVLWPRQGCARVLQGARYEESELDCWSADEPCDGKGAEEDEVVVRRLLLVTPPARGAGCETRMFMQTPQSWRGRETPCVGVAPKVPRLKMAAPSPGRDRRFWAQVCSFKFSGGRQQRGAGLFRVAASACRALTSPSPPLSADNPCHVLNAPQR